MENNYLKLDFESFAKFIVEEIKLHKHEDTELLNLICEYCNEYERNNVNYNEIDTVVCLRDNLIPALKEMKKVFEANKKPVARYKQTKIVIELYDKFVRSVYDNICENIPYSYLVPYEFSIFIENKIKEGTINENEFGDTIVDYINSCDELLELLQHFNNIMENEDIPRNNLFDIFNNITMQVNMQMLSMFR